ncbi:MAG: hypothetical protein J1E80_00500 [Desulfovibrionaceae bacterium]|nr:hypothetical protein [Desulfovibrionaceae bacterium]
MTSLPWRAHHAGASQSPDAPWDMLILFMALSGTEGANRNAMAEAARGLAPLALLVDWKRAERNLEVPADVVRRFFFFVTQPRAWRCAMAGYDKAGGLNAVLYAWRRRGRVVAQQACLAGCVGLALVAWEQGLAETKGERSGLAA